VGLEKGTRGLDPIFATFSRSSDRRNNTFAYIYTRHSIQGDSKRWAQFRKSAFQN